MNIKQIQEYDIWHEFFITANKQLHNEKITAMLESVRINNSRKELVFSFPIPNKMFQDFLFPKSLAFYTSNIHVKPIENSMTESLLVFSVIEVDNVSEQVTFINVQTKTWSNEINNPIDPDILLHRKAHMEEDAITNYYKVCDKPPIQKEITSHSFTANKNNILEFKTLKWLSITNNDFNQAYYNLKEFIENNYIILKIANLTWENKIDKDYNIKLERAKSYSYQENTYLPLETDQTLNNSSKPSRFHKGKHVYFYDPESSFPNHCYGKIKNVIYQNESYYYEILIRPNYSIPIKENKVFMSTPELDITDETIITIRKPIFSLLKWDYTIKQLQYLIWPFIAILNNNRFYAFIYVLQNFIRDNEQ